MSLGSGPAELRRSIGVLERELFRLPCFFGLKLLSLIWIFFGLSRLRCYSGDGDVAVADCFVVNRSVYVLISYMPEPWDGSPGWMLMSLPRLSRPNPDFPLRSKAEIRSAELFYFRPIPPLLDWLRSPCVCSIDRPCCMILMLTASLLFSCLRTSDILLVLRGDISWLRF